jgi:tetratricopeptide (TPR) repeat protein
MKKIIFIITVLICGIALNSCNEDLLDLEQKGALNPDVYYPNATDDPALQLIASIYSSVYTGLFWNGTFNGMSDDGSTFDNLNINSQNHPGNGTFSTLYRINYLCNLIIEKIPDNSATKAQVIGEAYFWRAYVNMYLIRLWGTPPLVDHVLSQAELRPANGDPDALWDYVETSLEEAIDLLPEKPALGSQSTFGGRVTKHSAYALLGKALLIQGDYPSAINTLEEVISSEKYELLGDYRDLYHLPADFCDEYLWEWNMDDADQANYLNEGDNRAVTLTWRTENVTVRAGLQHRDMEAPISEKIYMIFMLPVVRRDYPAKWVPSGLMKISLTGL